MFKILFTSLTSFFMSYDHITTQSPWSEYFRIILFFWLSFDRNWVFNFWCSWLWTAIHIIAALFMFCFQRICWRSTTSYLPHTVYTIKQKHCEMCGRRNVPIWKWLTKTNPKELSYVQFGRWELAAVNTILKIMIIRGHQWWEVLTIPVPHMNLEKKVNIHMLMYSTA